MRAWIATALRWEAEAGAIPLVIESLRDGRVVGSTRFGNIEPEHRRLEVGWTWIARPWQRTAVNTETKYLMLRHAFEALGCHRVELKTDVLNERSRRAIERIGGVQEGILRRHVVTSRGRVRDTVYYSILDREWPAVKARLEGMLARG
jgi:RimJ/RimL family protein N-acetyltransferase